MKKQFHYFASSFLNWTTNSDLAECLRIQKQSDSRDSRSTVTGCFLWRVPCEERTNYRIENYAPVVEGAEFLDFVSYTKKQRDKEESDWKPYTESHKRFLPKE